MAKSNNTKQNLQQNAYINQFLQSGPNNTKLSDQVDQQAFAEALVDNIVTINKISNLKEREQKLRNLSNNAATLLKQPKDYMNLLVKNTAIEMTDEYNIQLIKNKIPMLKLYGLEAMAPAAIITINNINKEAPDNKRKNAIDSFIEQMQNRVLNVSKAKFHNNFEALVQDIITINNITDSQAKQTQIQQLNDKAKQQHVTLPKPEQFKELVQNYQKSKVNTVKPYFQKYEIEVKELIKNTINEAANNINLPKEGIISKISNTINLMFTKLHMKVQGTHSAQKSTKKWIDTVKAKRLKQMSQPKTIG